MSQPFLPDAYGIVIAKLLREDRVCDLGPGKPNPSMYAVLNALTTEELFSGRPLRDPLMAKACHAGIWLYFDFLGESHAISQAILSTTGSYWHGIMHRREPDYPNAQYWFHKVPTHPIYDTLFQDAREMAASSPEIPEIFSEEKHAWDAVAFVDCCAEHYQKQTALEELFQKIQKREWELLFDYSYRRATGNGG